MPRLTPDRQNPYSGVDPLLAFLFDEVEKAESGVEYRQEMLDEAIERARRLREIFTLLQDQRRQPGPIAELPPLPTHDGGSPPTVTRTAEVIIKLEAGQATYPIPPHRHIRTVELARRDPSEHPDAAFTPVIPLPLEVLERHKKWIAEEDQDLNRLAMPTIYASDPTVNTVEFCPIPDREYFVRVVYRPVRES